jgi:hypothetical protein
MRVTRGNESRHTRSPSHPAPIHIFAERSAERSGIVDAPSGTQCSDSVIDAIARQLEERQREGRRLFPAVPTLRAASPGRAPFCGGRAAAEVVRGSNVHCWKRSGQDSRECRRIHRASRGALAEGVRAASRTDQTSRSESHRSDLLPDSHVLPERTARPLHGKAEAPVLRCREPRRDKRFPR